MADHPDIHYTLNIGNNLDDRNDPMLVTSQLKQRHSIDDSSRIEMLTLSIIK